MNPPKTPWWVMILLGAGGLAVIAYVLPIVDLMVNFWWLVVVPVMAITFGVLMSAGAWEAFKTGVPAALMSWSQMVQDYKAQFIAQQQAAADTTSTS